MPACCPTMSGVPILHITVLGGPVCDKHAVKSDSLCQVKKDKEDGKKKKKFQLGVAEAKMGNSIQEESGIPCVCNDFTGEVLRGIRMHATRFMKDLEESDMNKVSATQMQKSSLSIPHMCIMQWPLFSQHLLHAILLHRRVPGSVIHVHQSASIHGFRHMHALQHRQCICIGPCPVYFSCLP